MIPGLSAQKHFETPEEIRTPIRLVMTGDKDCGFCYKPLTGESKETSFGLVHAENCYDSVIEAEKDMELRELIRDTFEMAYHTPDIMFEYDNSIHVGQFTIAKRAGALKWDYERFTDIKQCLEYLKSLQ